MIPGTLHGVRSKHADGHLTEFAYRAIPRVLEASLFDYPIAADLNSKAVTSKELMTGAT